MNNNNICTAPLDHNFRGADGGRPVTVRVLIKC